MVADAGGRKELTSFRFRAFMWPLAPSPVPTDVSLTIQPIAARSTRHADLAAIGASFAKNMRLARREDQQAADAQAPGGQGDPDHRHGAAAEGVPGLEDGLLARPAASPGRLYMLSFRIDSRAAADAKVFSSIAKLFRFCPAKGDCSKA